jgi:EAL domain-containing protein (putative c-di-GMP-specific phosphodiesterase class I)/GGDEF domain-containing protein
MIRFFSMRRFPNLQNRLFGVILWLAVLDLTLDIGGSLTIENAAAFPAWVNYSINTVFYSLQILFPLIMVLYVIILRDSFLQYKKARFWLLLIPAALSELLILSNPLTHFVFYLRAVNGSLIYIHGPLFNILYIGIFFYVAVTLFIVLRYRRALQKKHSTSILAFIFIIISAVVVQFLFPAYLLTGVALTLAILIMFFNLQNPEDRLDLISGVFNYTAMMEYLNIRIMKGYQLWLVGVDIGGIRRINSAFGVSSGNACFAQVGKFFNGLAGSVRTFRMIGTRFLLIASTADEYRRVIEEVEERFQSPWRVNNSDVTLTVTIRYFSEWNFFKSPEDVVNLIDVAYSEIGTEGWGMKKRISTELLLCAKRSLVIESAIREAISTGSGFSLVFQPIYDTKTRRFTQAEALLRLKSPTLGPIPPAEFIPVAEKTGLILQIDELVIKKTCEFYCRNERDLRGVLTCLNINLSASEFYKNPSARLHGLIHESRIQPNLICFEVTETTATAHPGILNDFMRDLLCRGYRFALDDFGTGYANLTRVISLPFETVKLDRSLLQDNNKSSLLFAGMLDVFSTVGLTTIVEGIETEELAEHVCALGADMIQGFYYARPMSESELIALLKKQAEDGTLAP